MCLWLYVCIYTYICTHKWLCVLLNSFTLMNLFKEDSPLVFFGLPVEMLLVQSWDMEMHGNCTLCPLLLGQTCNLSCFQTPLPSVPTPRGLHIVSSGTPVLSRALCSFLSSPQEIPTVLFLPHGDFYAGFPSFSLFLPGTQSPNPQVFFILSPHLTYNCYSASRIYLVPYICPNSF